jgi:hypothetical protein
MISVSKILRRTLRLYVEQHALAPLAAALIAVFVALDRILGGHSVGVVIVTVLLALVVIGLFVGVVVMLVADVLDSRPRRSHGALLRAAWSALAPLLLVGVVGTIAIIILSSVPLLIVAILATAVVNGAGYILVLVLALPLISILQLVLQLRLGTSWSVSAAVVVLERPGRLRALGRSRELIRGSRWRVLALFLALAVPLAIAAVVIDAASGSASSVPGLAARVLVAALIAPIPMLATTVLYFELRGIQPNLAPADAPPSSALPPGISPP